MAIRDIKPKISIENLEIIYNQGKSNEAKVLENISLKIYQHEYMIIFGPSGCGKSTLLYTIAGFQKPSSGKIVVDGIDINSLRKKDIVDYHRLKIGMIFQSFFLVPTLSILDNVCLPQTFIGNDVDERRANGLKLLERFGIRNQADKFPSELSGGQKQRVAIARALMNNPDIIIADEPVGNLDSKSAFNVMSILSELNEKDKKTVLLVSHDPTHLAYGSRTVHMSDGKIVKIEEIVERKKMLLAGEDETVVKREVIAPEVQMLLNSFKNFTPSQMGMLLIPFKAQELLSHVLMSVPESQLQEARNKLQEVIAGRITLDDVEGLLDKEEEKGGFGWDKRNVRKMIEKVRKIMEVSQKIDYKDLEKTSMAIAEYLLEEFNVHMDDEQKVRLVEIIKLRLDNKLSMTELRKGLDRPVKNRGLGMDKRVAIKIAREIEIIMLTKYSA